MIEAIMAGAKMLGNKNAQNTQTAQGIADALGQGVPMQQDWNQLGDDELNKMSQNADFGGF